MAHHLPGPYVLSALSDNKLQQTAVNGTTGADGLPDNVPKISDPVVQEYLKGRKALIQQEDKQRSDTAFRESLSPVARKACDIIKALRAEEEVTIWGEDAANHTTTKKTEDGHCLYPGMMFGLAQKLIEKSKLFKVIRKMPKGSLLHCHVEAMVNYKWLFQFLLTVPGMHVSADRPILTAQDQKDVVANACHLKKDRSDGDSLCVPNYVPGTWIPVFAAARTFTNGPEAFINFLVSKCSISVEDSLNHREGINAVWAKFQNCFTIISPVVYYEPVYRAHLAHFFRDMAADNINYVEIRQPSILQFTLDGEETPLPPEDGWRATFRCIQEEVAKFKATEAGKDFWGVKIIWNTIRIFPDKDIYACMAGAIKFKKEFPDMIAGFDLVGQEDLGRTLLDLLPLLLWFRDACVKENVTIPFLFHAGETLQSGGPTDQNLFDAMLLGTRRIGHGYSLFKHPLLMEMIRDRQIMIEVCPISNEVLRLNTNTYGHPLTAMIAHGVPCAISNDDPGVLGVNNAGLSYDYFQVMQGNESLGLEGLAAMAENSIRYSVFTDEDEKTWLANIKNADQANAGGIKAERLRKWKQDWEEYCQWIVDEAHTDFDDSQDNTIHQLEEELAKAKLDRDKYKKAYEDLQKSLSNGLPPTKLLPRSKDNLTAVHRPYNEDQMYFLKNTHYIRADMVTDKWTNAGINSISAYWKIGQSADAWLPIYGQENNAYCFHGANYIKYDIYNDKVLEGPASWADKWTALSNHGFSQIDTALQWDATSAWFFQNDKCIRIDVETGAIKAEINDINVNFPYLAGIGPIPGIDIAIRKPHTNGQQAYFFFGDKFVTVDLVKGSLLHGPLNVKEHWACLARDNFYEAVPIH